MDNLLGIFLTIVVCLVVAYVSTKFSHRTRTTKSMTIRMIPPAQPADRRWRWESLSDREMEIARLVAQGNRNADIARELSISPHTVTAHLKSIYAKLDVHSRVELARALRDLVD